MNSLIPELEALYATRPYFHAMPDGTPTTWGLNREALTALAEEMREGMTTLETGAGYSTVMFAAANTRHTAIMMCQNEAEGIRSYCQERGLKGTQNLIVGFSDKILPSLADSQEKLDLVFIDGGHAFPIPHIDWFYTAPRIKIGGLFVLDDIHIPAVRSLHDFLVGEPQWKLEKVALYTSFFRKIAEDDYPKDWVAQGINKPLVDQMNAQQNSLKVRTILYLASKPTLKAFYRKYFKKTNG
jgi:predicted O-methyltransferase YrrM